MQRTKGLVLAALLVTMAALGGAYIVAAQDAVDTAADGTALNGTALNGTGCPGGAMHGGTRRGPIIGCYRIKQIIIALDGQASPMAETTTVQIHRDVKAKIDAMKIHHRESFNDVLQRILEDLEDISPEAMRRYDEIVKQVKAGKFKTHEQVRREWGL